MYWLEENNQASSIDDLMTQLIPTVQSVKSIRIISYPRSLEKVIAERLPLDIELDPRNSSHVLAVVRIGEEFRFGLTEREVNFFESSTEPKLSACFVSSAVCKLNEAFQRFQLMDTRFESVIDLGAAPGGWTQYLSQKAKVVYSVDGANLAPEVLQLKNVLHIKSNATNSIQSLKQQWLDGNAALNFTVDLIVSDMNVTPLTLIEILKSFVPLLKTNGRVLATLKFIGTTMDRQSQLERYHPKIKLLGISTVSGNQVIEKVTNNALQILTYAGLENIEVYEGVGKPLIVKKQPARHIHGESGMDLDSSSESSTSDFFQGVPVAQRKNPKKALLALRDAIVENSGPSMKVICTGPLTNMALFLQLYPELIDKFEVICMGGAIGIGNMVSGAEFNFFSDPHAAKMVFQSGVRLTMIPLEVTRLALFNPAVQEKMFPSETKTKFQMFVLGLMLFYMKKVREVYKMEYPAIHDPCAVYYAIRPEHFEVKLLHVEIETESQGCYGRSTCDIYGLTCLPRNCYVGTSMRSESFWNCMIDAVNMADSRSPLNK
eukprot:g2681.t1